MIFGDIYNDVVSSFGSLWSYKERGDSLEIITPFATTSSKFVSVFITKRGDEFIVSDGGLIADGGYNNTFNRDLDCYDKAFLHYTESFQVKETYGINGVPFFYKKTSKQLSVASIILDMANYISSLVSLSGVEYEVDRKPYDLFSKTANDYLSTLFIGRFDSRSFFDKTTQHVKPNAIISMENGSVILLNYVTGTNRFNFQNSIYKAAGIFELADKSLPTLRDKIENKITLIDDLATGYKTDMNYAIEKLTDKPKLKRVDWSKKEELNELLEK
ncbi:MAG: hypothetical protein H7257_08330 [Taibaiella sp.]|nr:hypothetical protein [Taibaiella sp.]